LKKRTGSAISTPVLFFVFEEFYSAKWLNNKNIIVEFYKNNVDLG